MNAAEGLEAGAAWLEKNGWKQRGYYGPNGTCAMLSLKAAGVRDDIRFDCSVALCAFLGDKTALNGDDYAAETVWEWNDAPGRTKEEVTSTMRAAAALWRAKNESATVAEPNVSDHSLTDVEPVKVAVYKVSA